MPFFQITSPDGKQYRVTAPDGATREDALKMLQSRLSAPKQEQQYNPANGPGELRPLGISTGIETPQWLDRGLSGAGKFMVDIGRGAQQVSGMDNQGEINASQRRDAPLMNTTAGKVGYIGGGVASFAPTAFIPGANTYTGSALIGAGLGALQPTTKPGERQSNMLLGSAGGVAGRALSGGISRILSPKSRAAVSILRREGVTPTPGQMMGGAGQRIEEGLTSIPGPGDFIRGGQRRAIMDFNRAALNRVLKPIGQTAKKIGNDGIEEAHRAVSQAYDDLLPRLTVPTPDTELASGLHQIGSAAKELAEPQQKRFAKILADKVANRIGRGKVSADTLKQVDSELGRMARGYKKSQDLDIRDLGDILSGTRQVLRDWVARFNPQASRELSNIDRSWATLLRVEDAANRTKDGIFTPAALRSASKKLDESLRHVSSAHGNALMQDLAKAGEEVLSAQVPDSGTPFRVFTGLGAGYLLDPRLAVGMAASGAAYTRPGMSVLAHALASRPQSVRALGQGVGALMPYSAAAGVPLMSATNQ